MRFSLKSPLGRVREAAWPIAQAAVAAGVAWALAQVVLGHPQPVFAPSAAVVALAASVGGRGTQAAEMLAGVAVGVVVGELLVLVLGTGAPQVALAAAASMIVMAAATNGPLPLIQAGSSAVLVVALQNPQSGADRMEDALVGGAVALLISQVLFPPSPVSLLEAASRGALGSLAEGLRSSARALDAGNAAAARDALERLREEERNTMSDLSAARQTSRKVARRTLRGRREARRLDHLDESAGTLDLLAGSVLLLSRTSCQILEERTGVPKWLVGSLQALAHALDALAESPESPDSRRRASEAAAEAVREAAHGEYPDPRVALAAEGIRLAASDVAELVGQERKTGREPPP